MRRAGHVAISEELRGGSSRYWEEFPSPRVTSVAPGFNAADLVGNGSNSS